MLNRFRLSRRAVWALAFILAASAIYWLAGRRNDSEIHLPDGRIMRVVGVTYGTNHVLEGGSVLAKLAAHIGASRWARRFGYSSFTLPLTNSFASLMVWMCKEGGRSSAPDRIYASVADPDGTEAESAYYSIATSLFKGGKMADGRAWRFDNFPRRQRTLRIRFYEYDFFYVRGTRLGEIMISNPARNVSPPLQAPLPPLSATNGELGCSLLSLRCGDAPPRFPLTAKYALAPWNTAEFALRENGRPATAWVVKRVEAFGATGNYLSVPGRAQNARLIGELVDERRVVHFANTFWPDEPDWKLIVEVARVRDFPADNMWAVRVPASSLRVASFFTNLQAEAAGLMQANLRLTPTEGTSPEPRSADRCTISLLLDYTPTSPDLHVDLGRAVDDQGRQSRTFNLSAPWHGRYQADLEIATNANTLELQFAIHRSRKFEFQVKPVFVSTNAPSTFPASAK